VSGFLLDTHLLLWSVLSPGRLSRDAERMIQDRAVDLRFSHATLWEVAIKTSLGKPGFDIDPKRLHGILVAEGFAELAIAIEHIAWVASLPLLHGDPFDRMLVAQAAIEGLTLLTADAALKRYGRFVRAV
jgi:PIN domain nuclease of toxin-antitoxin system